jgi:hypothetical protein
MSKRQINFDDLPAAAQAGISQEQKSYIDEFSFYYQDGLIEGFYAGELLAVWDGHGWQKGLRREWRLKEGHSL